MLVSRSFPVHLIILWLWCFLTQGNSVYLLKCQFPLCWCLPFKTVLRTCEVVWKFSVPNLATTWHKHAKNVKIYATSALQFPFKHHFYLKPLEEGPSTTLYSLKSSWNKLVRVWEWKVSSTRCDAQVVASLTSMNFATGQSPWHREGESSVGQKFCNIFSLHQADRALTPHPYINFTIFGRRCWTNIWSQWLSGLSSGPDWAILDSTRPGVDLLQVLPLLPWHCMFFPRCANEA